MRLPLRAWKSTLESLGFYPLKTSSKAKRSSNPGRMTAFEPLQERAMLTYFPIFSGGALIVVMTGADTVTITSSGGNVKINGGDVGTGTAASSVTSITIDGSTQNDVIDLSGVAPSHFTGISTSGTSDLLVQKGHLYTAETPVWLENYAILTGFR